MNNLDPIEITEMTEQIIQQWNEWADPVIRMMANWWFAPAYIAGIILWTGVWAWRI